MGQAADWRLVSADEFDEEECPRTSNWRQEEGFVRNEELQWYSRDNAFCEDGILVIEARRENMPNPRYQEGVSDWRHARPSAAFTSASLVSRGSWRYGRFEIRARIDTRQGLWPAFWSTGTIGKWPETGEIDILEFYSGKFVAALHWDGGQPTTFHAVDALGDQKWRRQFHVWRLDWDAQWIHIYVDARKLASYEVGEAVNRNGSNPFQIPHVFRLNFAIGGAAGGDPASTSFPARFEVDYFRVYQRDTSDAARP